jgi:hypothetical protein
MGLRAERKKAAMEKTNKLKEQLKAIFVEHYYNRPHVVEAVFTELYYKLPPQERHFFNRALSALKEELTNQ